jgi:coenzyme PQQ precursor peptide PqqA
MGGQLLYSPDRYSLCTGPDWEVTPMTWETPTFVEIKMDAEINSYQDDFDREDSEI